MYGVTASHYNHALVCLLGGWVLLLGLLQAIIIIAIHISKPDSQILDSFLTSLLFAHLCCSTFTFSSSFHPGVQRPSKIAYMLPLLAHRSPGSLLLSLCACVCHLGLPQSLSYFHMSKVCLLQHYHFFSLFGCDTEQFLIN